MPARPADRGAPLASAHADPMSAMARCPAMSRAQREFPVGARLPGHQAGYLEPGHHVLVGQARRPWRRSPRRTGGHLPLASHWTGQKSTDQAIVRRHQGARLRGPGMAGAGRGRWWPIAARSGVLAGSGAYLVTLTTCPARDSRRRSAEADKPDIGQASPLIVDIYLRNMGGKCPRSRADRPGSAVTFTLCGTEPAGRR
jgi:hypothetical protein